MKIKTKVHGQEADLEVAAQPRTWYPAKGENAAYPDNSQDVLLRLRFRDSEGDAYCYLRARWGHNFNQKWFVQECNLDNLFTMGCGEVWKWLPENRIRNLDAWTTL